MYVRVYVREYACVREFMCVCVCMGVLGFVDIHIFGHTGDVASLFHPNGFSVRVLVCMCVCACVRT